MYKKNVVMFGASKMGIEAYELLKYRYNVICFCDNDKNKWTKSFCEKRIISPEDLNKEEFYGLQIIITSTYYNDISKQLTLMGINNYKIFSKYLIREVSFCNIFSDGFYYEKNKKTTNIKYGKVDTNIKRLLFIESINFTKTYKIAMVLKELNVQVDLLLIEEKINIKKDTYLDKLSIFNNIISLGIDELKVLNFKDYDIVHNSNESKYVTDNLKNIDVPVVNYYDNESFLFKGEFVNKDIIELFEYKLYEKDVTLFDNVNEIKVLEKYNLQDRIYIKSNTDILKVDIPNIHLEKLSSKDNEIHFVVMEYLNDDYIKSNYLNDKLLELVNNKIHVHYYTNKIENYEKILQKNNYFHVERRDSEKNIIEQLTKYDVGLIIHMENDFNKFYSSNIVPKVLWRYISANIPIGVNGLSAVKNLIETIDVGKEVILNNNIIRQLEELKNINYKKNYIDKYVLDKEKEALMKFYVEVKKHHLSINNKKNIINKNNNIDKIYSEITIIIPTRNRSIYLKRVISYFRLMSSKELKIKIFILDSSSYDEKQKNEKYINLLKDECIVYKHFNEKVTVMEKLLKGIENVETEMCSVCADDDFLTKNGILESINILKNKTDYIAVKGKTAYFDEQSFEKVKIHNFELKDSEENNSLQRLQGYYNKGCNQLFYLTFRTKLLKDTIVDTISNEQFNNLNFRFQEYLYYFNVILHGKIKKIDCVTSIRENSINSGGSNYVNFHHTVLDLSFNWNCDKMCHIISENISKKDVKRFDKYELMTSFLINTLGISKEYIKRCSNGYIISELKKGFEKAGWIK